MAIRAVIVDIGGVLEITPSTGWVERWEAKLGLAPGELNEQAHDLWAGGAVGAISVDEVHRRLGEVLRLDAEQVDALMSDAWDEYLGTLNVELVTYFAGLRPRYRTAILSNSFVGAREREQERYGFENLTDLIIYSHEAGMAKPDPRIYRLTCAQLGVRPMEAVFLDDVEACVDAARDVGMQAIVFKDNAQAIAEIEARLTGFEGRPIDASGG